MCPNASKERIGEEIVEILVPQLTEEIVEVMKINPQDQREQIRFLTVGTARLCTGMNLPAALLRTSVGFCVAVSESLALVVERSAEFTCHV